MSIEDLLRQAADKGMTHLTVYPVHSNDRKTVYWHARVSPSTQHKYVEETDLDPVLALQRALAAMPKARRVTAAVNPNLRAQHNLPPIDEVDGVLPAEPDRGEPSTPEPDEWEKYK